MRVLIPDPPAFAGLLARDPEFRPYGRDRVPEDAEGAVLWAAPRDLRLRILGLPSLKWVLTLTAGVNHVLPDLPDGVALYNASDLHAPAVAQHALATMLAASRGLHLARDAQRGRTWARQGVFGGSARPGGGLHTLAGRRVVIWGHGTIGRLLEGMLAPLGATVTGLRSRTPREEIDAALAGADFVVLLLPSTDATRGLVDADVLARLKPGAWLANYGRGELIVEPDLVAALTSGTLGGAVLDVTDPEPLPDGSALWDLPNVILTPHVAAATEDIEERAAAFAGRFLDDLAAGRDPGNLVERGKGY